MGIATKFHQPLAAVGRALDALQPVLALGIRLWVGWQFFKSGLLKVSTWDTTLYLFREEYRVPLVSPEVAAVAGTFGELVFPVLLWLGLAGRFAALGLSAVNAMAVIAYAHVLFQPGYEAALGQHYLWGFALLVLIVYGPGGASLDRLVLPRLGDRSPRAAPARSG